jgi:hypothetical protein
MKVASTRVYEVVLLDSFTEEIESIDLMKVDVEGHELQVLKGFVKNIRKCKNILLELSPCSLPTETCIEILNILRNSGYSLYNIGCCEQGSSVVPSNRDEITNIPQFISSVFQTNILASKITTNTFNVLIATIGRPTLQRMLNSLSPQLNEDDCLTVVFDGHETPPIFDYSEFKCKVNIHCESQALGYWGHGIRNKYDSLLEKRDFVMHADDDDVYLENAFEELRKLCIDKTTLYISRMTLGYNGRVIPCRSSNSFWTGNIGTPCGIIPYNLNLQGNWAEGYGGDCKFYQSLEQTGVNIKFLDNVIYVVIPR